MNLAYHIECFSATKEFWLMHAWITNNVVFRGYNIKKPLNQPPNSFFAISEKKRFKQCSKILKYSVK